MKAITRLKRILQPFWQWDQGMTLAAEEKSGFRGQEVELWVKSNTVYRPKPKRLQRAWSSVSTPPPYTKSWLLGSTVLWSVFQSSAKCIQVTCKLILPPNRTQASRTKKFAPSYSLPRTLSTEEMNEFACCSLGSEVKLNINTFWRISFCPYSITSPFPVLPPTPPMALPPLYCHCADRGVAQARSSLLLSLWGCKTQCPDWAPRPSPCKHLSHGFCTAS